jgi:hypothetical protein
MQLRGVTEAPIISNVDEEIAGQGTQSMRCTNEEVTNNEEPDGGQIESTERAQTTGKDPMPGEVRKRDRGQMEGPDDNTKREGMWGQLQAAEVAELIKMIAHAYVWEQAERSMGRKMYSGRVDCGQGIMQGDNRWKRRVPWRNKAPTQQWMAFWMDNKGLQLWMGFWLATMLAEHWVSLWATKRCTQQWLDFWLDTGVRQWSGS